MNKSDDKLISWIREVYENIHSMGEFSNWDLKKWLRKRFPDNHSIELYPDPLLALTNEELIDLKGYLEEFCRATRESFETQEYGDGYDPHNCPDGEAP